MRANQDDESQFLKNESSYEPQVIKWQILSRAQAEIRGGAACVRRAGGLGTEKRLMAPVHPLGGHL